MAVCKFWRQGYCRNGDNCRFEHPPNQRAVDQRPGQSQGQNHNQNQSHSSPGVFARQDNQPMRQENQFGRRDNNFSSGPRNQGRRPGGLPTRAQTYGVDKDMLNEDLRKERPLWIMSAYGPGKDAPVQLFGGVPIEQSFEEVRMEHYLAVASGNLPQAVQREQELANQANGLVKNVLENMNEALWYIAEGTNTHPNRIDICAAGTDYTNTLQHANGGVTPSFGASPPPAATAPPALPAQPQPGAFGQNAAPIGAQPNAPFGQQPMQNNAFGSSPFGSKTASAVNSVAFGVDNKMSMDAFGQSQQPQPMGGAFGQTPQPNPAPFGMQNQAPHAGGFGAPSGFGGVQQAHPQPGQFGQQAGFGVSQQGAPPTPFPSTATTAPVANGVNTQPQASAPTTTSPNASNEAGVDIGSYSTRDASNRLTTWKGQPVTYKDNEPFVRTRAGEMEKIWFPNGPPPLSTANEMPDLQYSSEAADAYMFLRDNDKFKDGIMPEIPPKREWVRWDM